MFSDTATWGGPPPGHALRRYWRRPRALTFAVASTVLLLSLPLLVIAAYVFVPAYDVWRHLAGTVLPDYIRGSLLLAVSVGIGTMVVGTGTAWLVTLCRFPGRAILSFALLLPLAFPAYVIAYGYTGILDYAGPVQSLLRSVTGWGLGEYWFPRVRSLPGAAVMMTLVLYPYVYLLARAAFIEQSACVIEVSRTLGCSPWQAFFRIALPLARPAIAGGTALAVMETLNDFGTVQHFGVTTLTTGIFRLWLGMGEAAAAAQLAALLLVAVFVVLMFERWSRGARRFSHSTSRYRSLPRFQLRGTRAALALLACFLPVLFGFLLPAATLARWTIVTSEYWMRPEFLRLAANSFILSAVAAGLAVLIGLFLCYAQRLDRGVGVSFMVRFATLGYAIPGAVVAVGVMIPFAGLDNWVDGLARAHLGVSTGLILSGGIAAVTFAYLVRFMPMALHGIEAGLGKITPNMDDAARLLGRRPVATMREVHLPIMRGSVLTAALLVFVEVMKELPATLILRPFNFDTLAVRAYELATDEQLVQASSAALAIVLVGVLPVIVLARAISRSRPGAGAV
ncbi:MAG: iron ABC transporter permease [Rhodospirillaceae bacterium]|nr:iron ABC transporter permease [Rhodospirillaceae bacterium]